MGRVNAERINNPPDWRMAVWCKRCGHSRPVNLDHFIELRGNGASPWDRYLICGRLTCRGHAYFKAVTGPADLFFRLTRNWSRGN